MPSSKYHREQAGVLAGLALSTNDPTESQRLRLALLEHLEQAEALECETGQSPAPETAAPEVR
jgi:hypothetical protein